ncbi:6-phosphogluconolactonase [Chryseobacterium sp. SNU WT5]|uniref:6-phosphogluconolactonase n=1 Tax=Chryseobacterium sp. SNU WT5 TaxID=2594269 RepID=UPI00117E0338|nr:6-phosphogluconolactonase [Chryseobacterium sp. SNU WT5]QDP86551.1 6-phosphogluconolactonase [Chryseobacterium sp. SNU WT5]
MNLRIYKNIDDVISALAENICEVAKESIQARGQFNFVLSGGSSPKKLYELLASDSFKNKIDWDKTYFFFGDERFVPADDSQRNSVMVEEALFKPLKINKSNIFKIDTTGSPEESAQKYWQSILKHFDGKPVKFDFNLLGLGDNSHTASLFPNTSVLKETEATIKSIFVEEVDMDRITMTAPLINDSRHIAFLVFGEGKAEAVFHVLEDQSGSATEYPARLITKDENKVQWFLDGMATSRL